MACTLPNRCWRLRPASNRFANDASGSGYQFRLNSRSAMLPGRVVTRASKQEQPLEVEIEPQVETDENNVNDMKPVEKSAEVQLLKDAESRLEYLLTGVGDGYYEMFRSHVANIPPDMKALGWVCVTLCFGLSVYLPIYFLDCFMEFDPLAFRSPLSWPAFVQACEGVAAALPVMGLVGLAWRRTLRDRVPALRELQQDEIAFHAPLLSGMSPCHVAFSAMSGAFAVQLIVLPGIFEHMRVAAALAQQLPIIYDDLLPNLHEALERVHLPDDLPSVAWGIIPAGLIVAAGEMITHVNRLSEKEQTVINNAIDNADRYYRVVHSAKGPQAERASAAFKAVAKSTLKRGYSSAALAGASHTLLTMYLGALYLWSGGFMAPAVASMLVNATQWRLLQAALVRSPVRKQQNQ